MTMDKFATIAYNYLTNLQTTREGQVMYVITLICFAMIIDFISGTLAAKVNPDIEFKSKIGINGIIRKVASIVLLLFFLLIAPLIPGNAGVALLYVLYLGYFMMEIQSIFENYKKMGINIMIFEEFLERVKEYLNKRGDQ